MAKITADTNLLIRAAVGDDPEESTLAAAALERAELVAVTLPTLCEFVWVLHRVCRQSRKDIAKAVRELMYTERTRLDRPAAEAGLAVLEAGGDFADGVIAFEGRRLGGEIFATFDREAAKVLRQTGEAVNLLASGR